MPESAAAPLPRTGQVFFDVRGSSRTMRLSWYADTGVAVFSIWQGDRCAATFRLPLSDLPRMTEMLQTGPEQPGHPPDHGYPEAGQQAAADYADAGYRDAGYLGSGYQDAGYAAPAGLPQDPAYPVTAAWPSHGAMPYPATQSAATPRPAAAPQERRAPGASGHSGAIGYRASGQAGEPNRQASYLPKAGEPDRQASYLPKAGYPDTRRPETGYPDTGRAAGYPDTRREPDLLAHGGFTDPGRTGNRESANQHQAGYPGYPATSSQPVADYPPAGPAYHGGAGQRPGDRPVAGSVPGSPSAAPEAASLPGVSRRGGYADSELADYQVSLREYASRAPEPEPARVPDARPGHWLASPAGDSSADPAVDRARRAAERRDWPRPSH